MRPRPFLDSLSEIFVKNRYLISLLFFGLVVIIISSFFSTKIYIDTLAYQNIINLFQGKEVIDLPAGPQLQKIIRPMAPLIEVGLSKFFNQPPPFFLQNVVFYIACLFLIFKIVDHVYRDKKTALLAGIIWGSSWIIWAFSLTSLVDTGGWFFYLLSIYLILLWSRIRDKRLLLLSGLVVFIGALYKEYALSGAIFFFVYLILLKNINFVRKIKTFLIFLSPSLLYLVVQIFIGLKFNFTYIDLIVFGVTKNREITYEFFPTILNLLLTVNMAWFLIWKGAFREVREKNKTRRSFILAITASSLTFFLWPFPAARITYISAPLLALLAARFFNFEKHFERLAAIIFVLVYFSFNLLIYIKWDYILTSEYLLFRLL